MAKVIALCISEKKGTQKHEVPEAEMKVDHGIVGDAHAGDWIRQVSLLGTESVQALQKKITSFKLQHGAFAENVVTEGITLYELPVGTKLQIGEILGEVTQIGKQCHNDCVIKQTAGDCVMPREGIFIKILEPGTVHPGDEINIVS